MTWIGQRETMKKLALRIQRKEKLYAQRYPQGSLDIYRSWRRNEVVLVQETTDLKDNGIPWQQKMVQNFQETKHPVLINICALNRGILRQVRGKLFTSTLNRRILNYCSKSYSLRISSVFTKQLRIGVINWDQKKSEEPGNPSVHEEIVNKGLMNSVKADEVNSLVSTARLIAAPGNRLSGDVKKFDDMPWHSQFSTLCDLVSWRKVQSDGFFITKPSSTDGHGGIDTQCKEKTFSRSDPRGQNSLRNSMRNKYWASQWDKSRTHCWNLCTRKCSSFNKRLVDCILGTDI